MTDQGANAGRAAGEHRVSRATAYDLVLGLRGTQDLLTGLDQTAADQARERLYALLAAHTTPDGVFFDSRAWIITAQVPDSA